MSEPSLIRQIAEALGYYAASRKPRGSLNLFYEVLSPDETVCGSASGRQDDESDIVIEMAWQDAMHRLPAWTTNLNNAMTLLHGHRWMLICDGQTYRASIEAGLEAEAETPALAICKAWLAWHHP
jgi:hypothetical protein